MTQIKGIAIRGTLKFIKQMNAPGGIPGVLEELSPNARSAFSNAIVAGNWYPYPAFSELLRVVDRRFGNGDLAMMATLGRFAARQDVGSIFKVVSVLAGVKRVLQSAPFFWQRYCDRGSFVITEIGDDHGVGELRDFPNMTGEHAELLCGWIEAMGLAAGAKDSRVALTKGVHRGDGFCEYTMRWSG